MKKQPLIARALGMVPEQSRESDFGVEESSAMRTRHKANLPVSIWK